MARSTSGRVQASGSSLTAALPAVRLTAASCTPGSPRSAFSMVVTQAAQVIPATGTLSSSIFRFSFSAIVSRYLFASSYSSMSSPTT